MASRKPQTTCPPESFLPELHSYSRDTLEIVKQSALRRFHLALSLEEKAQVRMTVARCHHERSLRFAEENGRGSFHPDFNKFLAHYLAASQHHEDPEVLAYLQGRYPPPDVPMIRPGDPYWRH
jgi:hypothetical protein